MKQDNVLERSPTLERGRIFKINRESIPLKTGGRLVQCLREMAGKKRAEKKFHLRGGKNGGFEEGGSKWVRKSLS